MKINMKQLLDALTKVNGTTKIDKDSPILKGILCTQQENLLLMQSTNTNMSTIVNIPVEEGANETFCVEGKLVLDVLKKLQSKGSESIEIKISDKKLKYTLNDFEGDFELLDSSLFPIIDGMEGEQLIIKGEELKNIIHYTACATSLSETNPILQCCHLEISTDEIKATGLDGYRMSHYVIPYKNENIKETLKYNVPSSFLKLIANHITSNDMQIGIMINPKQMALTIDNDIFIGRLMEGDFLPYEQMITTDFKTTICINREDFLSKLGAFSSIRDSDNKVLLKMKLNDTKLTLEAFNNKANLAASVKVAQQGEDIELIGFDNRYLTDGFRIINTDQVIMFVAGPEQAAFIRPNDENVQLLYMVLPVAV